MLQDDYHKIFGYSQTLMAESEKELLMKVKEGFFSQISGSECTQKKLTAHPVKLCT